jgi:hypothetical protein
MPSSSVLLHKVKGHRPLPGVCLPYHTCTLSVHHRRLFHPDSARCGRHLTPQLSSHKPYSLVTVARVSSSPPARRGRHLAPRSFLTMAHPLYGTKMDVLYDNKLDRFNLRHANPPRHGIYQCQEETCSEFGRTFSARKHFCMHKHRAEKCMTPLCPYYGSTFTPNCSFKVHLKQVRHIAAVEYQRKAEAAGKILPRMTSSDWNRKMLEDFGKSELVPAAMEEIDDSLLPKNDDLDIADTELFGPLDKAERLAQLNRNWKLVSKYSSSSCASIFAY